MATAVADPAARSSARYVRSSASKARAVLDLIRGESCERADEILQFSERRIARTVARCLDSAIANAEHNSGLAAEELYVAACYADEGPTLKRWRPRARGRATPIMKRTCHITIVLARYSLAEREVRAERGVASSAAAAEVRRRRVAASRATAEETVAEEDVIAEEGATVEPDASGSSGATEQDASPQPGEDGKES